MYFHEGVTMAWSQIDMATVPIAILFLWSSIVWVHAFRAHILLTFRVTPRKTITHSAGPEGIIILPPSSHHPPWSLSFSAWIHFETACIHLTMYASSHGRICFSYMQGPNVPSPMMQGPMMQGPITNDVRTHSCSSYLIPGRHPHKCSFPCPDSMHVSAEHVHVLCSYWPKIQWYWVCTHDHHQDEEQFLLCGQAVVHGTFQPDLTLRSDWNLTMRSRGDPLMRSGHFIEILII